MLPPLNPEVLFPAVWIGHAGTDSAQPGDFFSFPTRKLRTVLLCENRSGQIFLLLLFVALSGMGRQRDAGLVQSITIYQETDVSPHFVSACEGGQAP